MISSNSFVVVSSTLLKSGDFVQLSLVKKGGDRFYAIPFKGGVQCFKLKSVADRWIRDRGAEWTVKGSVFGSVLCDKAKGERFVVQSLSPQGLFVATHESEGFVVMMPLDGFVPAVC